jgi:hypothetical protein
MPLPLIGSKPYFLNTPNPSPAPYAVSLPRNSIILGWALTPAVIQALVPGCIIRVTLQRAGNSPSGAYPKQQAHQRPLDQASINYIKQMKEILLELRDLAPFRTGTNQILRIDTTDPSGQSIAISINLTVILT